MTTRARRSHGVAVTKPTAFHRAPAPLALVGSLLLLFLWVGAVGAVLAQAPLSPSATEAGGVRSAISEVSLGDGIGDDIDHDSRRTASFLRQHRSVPQPAPTPGTGFKGLAERAHAATATIKVFCDQGESIHDALQNPALELNILVRGFCSESVEIRRDRVTLSGEDPSTDGIDAPQDDDPRASALRIREARRVHVENLGLRGGSFEGLRILQSTDDISVTNVRLVGNAVRGATVLDSIVTMNQVVATANGTADGGGRGGLLASGSTWLSCRDCSIHTNADDRQGNAIWALQTSEVQLIDTTLEGRIGVVADHGATVWMTGGGLEAEYAAVVDTGARLRLSQLSFEGALFAYDQADIRLFEAKQSAAGDDNYAFGGSLISLESPRLDAELPTFLVRPLYLSGFARATVFSDAEVPSMQCSLGADAVCTAGARVGASTCDQCPQP